MVLSKRERYVFSGALVAVSILALDYYAISPLMAQRDAMEADKAKAVAELNNSRSAIQHRRQLAPKWREMIAGGLKSDPAEAESQVFHAIRDWCEEAGITLSLKPERSTEKTRLPEITFQASGKGNMNAVVQLLWRIQTATIPIKVTEMTISARTEGADDLVLSFRVSTIYAPRIVEANTESTTQPEASE